MNAVENRKRQFSGYHACPCFDCFETAVGCDDDGYPSLCLDCERAGCSVEGAAPCQCPPRDELTAAELADEAVIMNAYRAEKGLAEIARVRPPTDGETRVALAAYAAAAAVQAKK